MKVSNSVSDVNLSIGRFVIPSLAGVFLFLIPISLHGQVTLLINYLVFSLRDAYEFYIMLALIITSGLSALGGIAALIKPDLFKGYLKTLFQCSPVMVLVRITACILIIMIHLKSGPEAIWSADTGGAVMYGFVTTIALLFLLAGPLLPLLTEFGFMEFVGELIGPVFRPVLKLPGRAGVHFALALVASSTISAVLSAEQYEKGHYNAREAIIMGTGFSVISVPQVALFTEIMGLSNMFLQVYIIFILSILLINFIMVRIPPISTKPDAFVVDRQESVTWSDNEVGYFKKALNCAVTKANSEIGMGPFVEGIKMIGDIWFTLIPQVIVLGVAGILLVDYTPLTQWLSYPFIILLSFLQVPETAAAAPAMIIGFVDPFLTVIVGGRIGPEVTRFVILIISMVQVVFITTIAPILLKSKVPISFLDLVVIFLERTLIALPLAALLAHIIF
ncbi:MAG: nucleoside recognition domain-containing protein [Syntrophomonadaceae bacterium]|nr:nucleoside recognition domain-containing protein [Syntrophomonadaceae bacterium]MDD3890053.1 nucleoside recognition domain-containing protein [Syntrophomonadaceae bacterium]MDD4548426.1 nucleoside recognition domain-containing protein [Syntrophomonadaceae bacterium]